MGDTAPVDVAARLRRAAAARPDAPALVYEDGRRTYGELHARVDAGTAALQQLGVGGGDRVALVAGTTPGFVEVFAAILRAGAAAVPLLPGLAPDELRHALADSQAQVAVVGPERIQALAGLADELPDLRTLIGLELGVADAQVDAEWEQLLEAAGEPRVIERRGEDLAALVYTSGTTGRPRGAMLSRANLAANQDQSLAGRFEVAADDVVLVALPLAHIYALNVGLGASITVGATIALVERFDPSETLAAIAHHGVTVLLGAPPMYLAWLESGALDADQLASVRLAVSGAAPLPVPALERFRDATGLTIEEGYGLTEASPSVSSTSMAPAPRPGTVGLPLPGVEIRLVDDEGRDVADGDPGEVWVRGPNVFSGYWRDEEATAGALTADGWLRTGDIGVHDSDGHLQLVDRKRDLILVNGFNVYPREVERVLLDDPTVSHAAVVGEPHPLAGEAVVAHVVARAERPVDVEDLQRRCRRYLARYKCPSRIVVADELPHTATGKVRRRDLRRAEGT